MFEQLGLVWGYLFGLGLVGKVAHNMCILLGMLFSTFSPKFES